MINGRIIWDTSKVLDLHNIVDYRRTFEEDREDNFSVSRKHEAISFGEQQGVRLTLQKVSRSQAYRMLGWWSWARRGQEFSFEMLPESDLVTNGVFDADSGWSKGTGWSIGSGVANCDGSQVAVSDLYQDAGISNGAYYQIIFTVMSYSAGQVRPNVGGTGAGTYRSANGTYIETVQAAGGNSNLYISGDADFSGDIDDVMCWLAPGDTTLDDSANSHQKTVPLTITPFSAGDYAMIKEASGDNYEVVQVSSVNPGVDVTLEENLTFSYVSGDIFRKLDYFPNLVMKPTRFDLSLPGPGLYFDIDLEFQEIST